MTPNAHPPLDRPAPNRDRRRGDRRGRPGLRRRPQDVHAALRQPPADGHHQARRRTRVGYVVALARESGLKLAVRSGGHSGAGHSASDGGIVLDLSLMKGLEIDPGKKVAWAETGLTASEVTNATAAHGLAVGFGDTGSVGLGGLTTGGGGVGVSRPQAGPDDRQPARRRDRPRRRPDPAGRRPAPRGPLLGDPRRRRQLRRRDALQVPGSIRWTRSREACSSCRRRPRPSPASWRPPRPAPEELSTIANVMTAPPMPFIPEEHRRGGHPGHARPCGPTEDGEQAVAPSARWRRRSPTWSRPMTYQIYPPEDPEYRPLAAAALRVRRHDRARGGRADPRASPGVHGDDGGRAFPGPRQRDGPGPGRRHGLRASAEQDYGQRGSHLRDRRGLGHEDWVTQFTAALRQSDDGMYVNFVGDEDEAAVTQLPGATWATRAGQAPVRPRQPLPPQPERPARRERGMIVRRAHRRRSRRRP